MPAPYAGISRIRFNGFAFDGVSGPARGHPKDVAAMLEIVRRIASD
jgi:hypothetical protein